MPRSPTTRAARSRAPSARCSIRQTSKPRNTLVTSPGGKAPAWRRDHRCAEVDALGLGPAHRGEQAGGGGGDRGDQRLVPGPVRRARAQPRGTPAWWRRPKAAPASAGTAIEASLIWDSENGRQRASPPVRVSTRSPPSSGMVAPNRASAAEHRGQHAHAQGLGRVRDHDGPDQHEQRLREAQQPLPLPPDQRLQPDALAPRAARRDPARPPDARPRCRGPVRCRARRRPRRCR